MKKYLFIYLSTILIFNMFLFSDVYSQKKKSSAPKITVTLNTNKYEYLESEPVWVELNIIINKETKLDRPPELWLLNDLICILTNSKGDTLKYRGGQLDAMGSQGYPHTMYHVENLLLSFGINERYTNSSILMSYYLPEDSYNVTFIFNAESNNKTHYIKSNTEHFVVSKAVGDELKAYGEWLRIREIFLNEKENNETKKFSEIKEVVDTFNILHPESVFFFKVNIDLMTYSFLDHDFQLNMEDYALNQIKNYPDNYYNYVYLSTLIDRYYEDDKSKKDEFLNNLIKGYPNTILAKYCIERQRWMKVKKQ